ncbi:MAG: DUF1489 family protein [Alphaproteobacteria bacterium]
MSSIHLIKLVVGVEDLKGFKRIQEREAFDYHGQVAVPCWTRYKPKCADEILEKGGSIYRVIKNRIQCRHKILGFEMVETDHKGTMCMIVQDAQMIEVVQTPRRAFQGWRYLKIDDVPADKGIYVDDGEDEVIPDDLAHELKEAGIL